MNPRRSNEKVTDDMTSSSIPVFGSDFEPRVCQFHVLQAIRRWDTERTQSFKPTLSHSVKRRIEAAFKELQRCSDERDWEKMVEDFEARIRSICSEEEEESGKVIDPHPILEYFHKYWFGNFWRREHRHEWFYSNRKKKPADTHP